MIYQKNYFVENPKATIIIVHGIAEHGGRYEHVAKFLNYNNYDVITYDQLGHGKSSGKRGKIKSFHEHIDSLHKVVLHDKQRNNNKIFLLGHSMGGLVVNLYQVKYGDIAGVISVAAATQTPKDMKIFKYIGFKYLSFISVSSNIFNNDLAKDPNVSINARKDPLRLKRLYLSLLGEMFIKGVKYLHKNIEKYDVPVLFLHGKDDKIVSPEFSELMFNKIYSKDKDIILYDNGYHELLNDYNQHLVMQDIIKWLDERK